MQPPQAAFSSSIQPFFSRSDASNKLHLKCHYTCTHTVSPKRMYILLVSRLLKTEGVQMKIRTDDFDILSAYCQLWNRWIVGVAQPLLFHSSPLIWSPCLWHKCVLSFGGDCIMGNSSRDIHSYLADVNCKSNNFIYTTDSRCFHWANGRS